MLELVFAPAALRKLDLVYDHIANVQKTPQTAVAVVGGIIDCLDVLKSNPEIGFKLSARIAKVPARFAQTRFFVCNSYVAIYGYDEKVIYILAIYHAREDFFARLFQDID